MEPALKLSYRVVFLNSREARRKKQIICAKIIKCAMDYFEMLRLENFGGAGSEN